MRIQEFKGKYFIQIGRIQRYVQFRFLRKKRTCADQILVAHHAFFFALSMVGGQEIFLKMSKYFSSGISARFLPSCILL